jgi:hypothetical protein
MPNSKCHCCEVRSGREEPFGSIDLHDARCSSCQSPRVHSLFSLPAVWSVMPSCGQAAAMNILEPTGPASLPELRGHATSCTQSSPSSAEGASCCWPSCRSSSVTLVPNAATRSMNQDMAHSASGNQSPLAFTGG